MHQDCNNDSIFHTNDINNSLQKIFEMKNILKFKSLIFILEKQTPNLNSTEQAIIKLSHQTNNNTILFYNCCERCYNLIIHFKTSQKQPYMYIFVI